MSDLTPESALSGSELPESELSGSDFDWRSAPEGDVEQAYSPSQFSVRPLADYLVQYRQLSDECDEDSLRAPDRPLLVYIHGGYWQQLSAADSLFNGEDAIRHHVSLVAVEYTLAPAATVDQIVQECIEAVRRACDELRPTRVVLAGSSAGAHLAAMCMQDPHLSQNLDGVALLSGIYDLRPLVRTGINEPLHLTDETAATLSPMLSVDVLTPVPILCAVAEHDPPEFIRQNDAFASHLQSHGCDAICTVVTARDHFDLPYDLLREGTVVGDWVLSMLKG